MSTTVSSDGTTIAYEKIGSGPPLVLVDGALCHRAFGPARPLAEKLKNRFTVYIYDRRGRGDSGNTAPYSVEREIDDLAAVIKEAGGEAGVYGISSGAALVLEAARRGLPMTKVAVYETPLVTDGSREVNEAEYVRKLNEYLSHGENGKAVKHFMRLVGAPSVMIALFPLMPPWRKLKAVAPTLPYDAALLGDTEAGHADPIPQWAATTVPTLVMGGGESPGWMQNTQRTIAEAIPGAQHKTIVGQTHMLKPDAIAPVLTDYFAS
jgi:pimeloyl-ACP methyl ester carboxylesterase